MLSRRSESGERDLISTIRDLVEIVAIIAAGCWAFYVFAYENRIKPSFASPDVNVVASMQRLSTRNGLIAVKLHVEFRNVGTVQARFLAVAVNVYGQRVIAQKPQPRTANLGTLYDSTTFARSDTPVAVFTWAYVTDQGDATSHKETTLDVGGTIENDRIFYVPQGKFDLLTMGIDAPYTKYDGLMPSHLAFRPDGGIKVETSDTSRIDRFNITPATSLDIR